MKTTLTVDIEYDPQKTDPEGLASAMDRLLETALSTPGIMEEYGDPRIGEFFVAREVMRRRGRFPTYAEMVYRCCPATVFPPPARKRSVADSETTRWAIFNTDTSTFLTTSTYGSYEEAVEVADRYNDVLVLPLSFEEVPADQAEEPPATWTDEKEAALPRLLDKTVATGLQAESLDDLVHEVAADMANGINNSGLNVQLVYLIKELGAEATEQRLAELIDELPDQGE